MPLSSNVLFHFTDSVHNLIDILSNEFRPHYCLEDFSLVIGDRSADAARAFPMISFCDIPLSQAAKHMLTYGNYALGLNKEWGIRNGIAPVLYCYENSASALSISETIRTTYALRRTLGKNREELFKEYPGLKRVSELGLFVKQYEGPFLRRGRIIPNVRFYDERVAVCSVGLGNRIPPFK